MLTPIFLVVICKLIAFGLLFLHWIYSGEAAGFIPVMALGIMTALRYRFPRLWRTVALDAALLWFLGLHLALSIYVLSELFFRAWQKERKHGLTLRDIEAGKYYELEQLQTNLLTATAQIERMTTLSERARIAREIHDNAGHEIVAAYISLQTARGLLEETTSGGDMLELYDAALERLDKGANKIREAVHNLAPVAAQGVESLQDICKGFTLCPIEMQAFGDMTKVPVYVWAVLESCLQEALTNAMRHAKPAQLRVNLDATPHIVRLCVENDGIGPTHSPPGSGLRNLRQRAAAVGGSLSFDAGEVFRLVCVVPVGTGTGCKGPG